MSLSNTEGHYVSTATVDDTELIFSSPSVQFNTKQSIFVGYKGKAIIILACIGFFLVGLFVGLLEGNLKRKSCSEEANRHLLLGPIYNLSFSKLLQSRVDPNNMLRSLQYLASDIHRAGSTRNNILADNLANTWRDWGWPEVKLHPFRVFLPEPVDGESNQVQLISKNVTTGPTFIHNITTTLSFNNGTSSSDIYHAFSGSGEFDNADYVYAHYARSNDLDILVNRNVSFCRPKPDNSSDNPQPELVVIARLGYGNRNVKVRQLVQNCHRMNALPPSALLLYPDPVDYAQSGTDPSQVYPQTWWLPGDAPIWGGIRMVGGGGDYRTPGFPSLNGSYETGSFENMSTPFPVQPISYNDARILLDYLNGPSVPEEWSGSIATRLGPSDVIQLRVRVKSVLRERVLTNVMAVMPGSSPLLAEQTVIVGNHRDAWLFGASDPISGTVILSEVAKIIGNAYKTGNYRPRRTLMLMNWDGEEFGLLGSSEFVNLWRPQILHSTIAYLNMDCPIKGDFGLNVRSDPLLWQVALEASRSVSYNETASLYDVWSEARPLVRNHPEKGPMIPLIGGDSDHLVFSSKYGIPSIYPEWSFATNSMPSMPTYHSQYDNIDYIVNVLDRGMRNHTLVAKFVLDAVLRLLDTPLIPYDMESTANVLQKELIALQNSSHFKPLLKLFNVSLDHIQHSMDDVFNAISDFRKISNQSTANISFLFPTLSRLNEALLLIPRTFTYENGLPNRSYYYNIMFANGASSANGLSILTGLKEALQTTSPAKTVKEQVNALQLTLTMMAKTIRVEWIYQLHRL